MIHDPRKCAFDHNPITKVQIRLRTSFATNLAPRYDFYISNPSRNICLYNFDPFKPHFYIVKLGFTGVYIIFLISAQKHTIRLWVLVRTASARRF